MRKVLFLPLILVAQFASAQLIFQNTTTKKVGIEINAPELKLDVQKVSSVLDGMRLLTDGGKWLRILPGTNVAGGYNEISRDGDAGILFGSATSPGTPINFGFVIAPHSSQKSGLRIDQNGNIGIGNNSPQTALDVTGDVFCKNLKVFDGNVVIGTRTTLAKVDVIGDINCRKLKVLPTTWPDYVFKPEYELMPLSNLKEFIRINKHLPGVPNEKQVAKDGVELGEMNTILLQKVEELTLYLLEIQQQLDEQKRMIKELQKNNSSATGYSNESPE